MINSKHLRVGNKLLFGFNRKPDQIVTVAWVSDTAVGYLEQHEASYPQSPQSFEPIPLTSEIIGKCKSNAHALRYQVRLNKMVIEIDDLKVEISTPEPIDGIRESSSFAKVPVIEHLHQLQNLFFALTGQELEVKL